MIVNELRYLICVISLHDCLGVSKLHVLQNIHASCERDKETHQGWLFCCGAEP